jgi:hypothetical protein
MVPLLLAGNDSHLAIAFSHVWKMRCQFYFVNRSALLVLVALMQGYMRINCLLTLTLMNMSIRT